MKCFSHFRRRHEHHRHFGPFQHRNREDHAGFPFGGRGRGRGGPGRFFESGDLRYVILHLIAETPRHGYDLIKAIEDKLGGSYAPSPGVVYPTLTLLEEMGHAVVTVEGTRKLYAITDEGRKVLEANRPAVDAILGRMQQAGEQHAQERPGQILRAMQNLQMALRMRAGKLTPEQLNAVTDILDNAAKQIERT